VDSQDELITKLQEEKDKAKMDHYRRQISKYDTLAQVN